MGRERLWDLAAYAGVFVLAALYAVTILGCLGWWS